MRLVIGAKTKPACRFLYLFVAGIIIVGFFIKHYKISRGNIAYLSLNATEISIQKPLKYETLAHIIEEMAIASNMPMARVFVLEKMGINAMCSGKHFGKRNKQIAIFITKGALQKLSREELQGGYRHEFSHTFDNDIELNSRLIAVVFGLGCVVEFGVHLASGKRRSNKNNGGGAIIALVFIILGLLGMLCARILQAVISRQKEFR